MDKFWMLYEKNVVISGALALGLVGTACYLWATGQAVPTLLAGLLGTVIGYFFGAGKMRDTVTTLKG